MDIGITGLTIMAANMDSMIGTGTIATVAVMMVTGAEITDAAVTTTTAVIIAAKF
jgi:hypothetical protein